MLGREVDSGQGSAVQNESCIRRKPTPSLTPRGAWSSGIVVQYSPGGFGVVASHNQSFDRTPDGAAQFKR
jgi:hypothetical protein